MRTPARYWSAISLIVCLCNWCFALAAEAGPGVASVSGAATGVTPTSPAIEQGMTLRLSGNKIIVAAGQCWVNDRLVDVPTETVLDVELPATTAVRDQSVELSPDGLNGMLSKTILPDLKASPADPVPLLGILVPGSLKVKAASGASATPVYRKGADYALDEKWGAIASIPGGAIKKGQTVYVDYKHAGRRLDTVVVAENGKVSLQRGTTAKSAPVPPVVPPDLLALANIYVPPAIAGGSSLEIVPIKTLQPVPLANELRDANRKALTRTLAKLRSGGPVSIVFWGDSITGGADASSPDKFFSNQFLASLRGRFPTAQISATSLGVGATNTNQRLAGLATDVLSRKPDLVIVEFVNDLMVPVAELEANYAKIISQSKGAGAELILCTPHLPNPKVMAVASWQAVAAKPYIKLVRHTAATAQVALADVAARWNSLRREGLRPDFMLIDEVIHPNDRGHAIYAEELLKCFD